MKLGFWCSLSAGALNHQAGLRWVIFFPRGELVLLKLLQTWGRWKWKKKKKRKKKLFCLFSMWEKCNKWQGRI